MAKASLMHVHNTLQELLEVEAGDRCRESTSIAHILVQLTSSDQFLDDIGDLMGISIARSHRSIFCKIDILDDALMIHSCCCLNFLSKQNELISVEGRIVVAEDFDCVAKVIFATCCMIHFCCGSFAHFLPQSVAVYGC